MGIDQKMPCAPDLPPGALTVPAGPCRHRNPEVCRYYRQEHHLDRVVRYFNAVLLELECIRARKISLGKRWHRSASIAKKALRFLSRRGQPAQDARFYERLHSILTSYYPYLSETHTIRRIPVVSVVMHHRAVAWWLRHGPLPSSVPILHVDSHIDMNAVHLLGGKLKRMAAKVVSHRKAPDALDGLLWDIGSVVTGYLYLGGMRDVVWLHPPWIKAQDHQQVPVQLIENRGSLRYCSKHKVAHAMDPRVCAKSSSPGSLGTFRYSQTQGQTRRHWDRLAELLAPTYLLDVDLDYFVTNGVSPGKRKFESEAHSPHRTSWCKITQSPRFRFDNTSEWRQRQRHMNREFTHVQARIRTFLKGLRRLRNKGCRPALISLSDSCSTIGGLHAGISWSNDYTPSHLVLSVRTQLLEGLRKIFG